MKRTQYVGKSKAKNKTKMKVYSTKEAKRIARRNGWVLDHKKGDHFYYKHPDYTRTLIISDKLNRMVWERCVHEFNLDLNK